MRFRTVLALAVILTICVFVTLNWRVFSSTVKLNLIVASPDVPVGTVMLALFAIIIGTLAIYVGIWQSTFLVEFRRQTKELEAQRALADRAEASRFTELGTMIHTEIAALDARMESALETLRRDFRDAENSIAATLGELDERMTRTSLVSR